MIYGILFSFSTCAQQHIPVISVKLVFNFGSLDAAIDEKGKLKSIVLLDGEKSYVVPLEEMSDIDNPRLNSLKIYPIGGKDFKSPNHSGGAWLVISLDYGNCSDVLVAKGKKEEREEQVYNRVFFVFKSSYIFRNKRLAKDGDSVWKLLYKDVGKMEIDEGFAPIRDLDLQALTRPPSLPVE
jgi:hypothetical protein